jgi:ribosome-associated protein
MTGEDLAKLCAKYAEDKKAENIIVLDVNGISTITDYFVICTASSPPHLRAIQAEIDDMLIKDHDMRPRWRDTNYTSEWVVLDYADVVVHVFMAEKREFYALEELWSDGKTLEWQ